MKRKQPDFQKTKLKVGRQLPKGRNITNTSFKTKQIITPDQLKTELGDKPLHVLLKLLDNKNASQKIDALHKLSNYVKDHKDTLFLYFPDVLTRLGIVLMESDPKVRGITIDVMSICIKLLSDLQYKSFSLSMAAYLNCMMTHVSTVVKKDSLKILDVLLRTHPKIVSRSPKILINLLNMISSVKPGVKVRKLDDSVTATMTSRDWRMQVLLRIQIFLKAMQESQNEKVILDEKREVHWDGKEPLYLPLYIDGGPNPLKLDYSGSTQVNTLTSIDFKQFIIDLVPVLSDIIKGEIPHKRSRMSENCDIFSPIVIQYLNTILRILCCIGEWAHQTLDLKESKDQEFSQQLLNIVSHQFMRGFPYSQHDPSVNERVNRRDESECLQLNLGICYLYAMFCLENEGKALSKKREAILSYLKEMFVVSNKLCDKSINLILKISKLLMQSENIVIPFKNGILVGLYGILDIHKLTVHSKMLYSFFMELSLDYNFQYLLHTDGMVNWFEVLFKELNFMKESGRIDQEFLRYIKQICVRKYPEFMEILNKVKHENILEFLKYEHEEFQTTIIHMIIALDNISSDLLEDLSELIYEQSISVNIASRLIRLLQVRFSRPETSEKDTLLFVKFLLNVGCDTLSIQEPPTDFEEVEFMGMLMDMQQGTRFQVYPTQKWQRHQKIFEVCLEGLLSYSENELVAEGILIFIQSILMNYTVLPVHSAMTFLHLRDKFGYMYQDTDVEQLSYLLMFSSLMYISVVTNEAPASELALYCIPELQSSLIFDVQDTTNLLKVCSHVIHNYSETEIFYALKIIMFLTRKNKIDKNENQVYDIFEEISDVCQQSTLLAPLWRRICNVWELN